MVLFVTLVDMALPDGEMRRFVKLVLGLVVVLVMVHPILSLVVDDAWIDRVVERSGVTSEWMENSQEVVAAGQEVVLRRDQAALERKMSALIRLVGGIEAAEVHLAEDKERWWVEARITVDDKLVDRPNALETVRDLLSEFYGFNPADIHVSVTGSAQGEGEHDV